VKCVLREMGATALHIAAQEGDGPILEQLLQAGAAVSLRTKRGATPLLYAAWSGRAASVLLLLAAGASISDVDEQGRTALHVAVPEASCCGAAMPAGLGSLARGAAVHLLSAWPADLPPWLPACLCRATGKWRCCSFSAAQPLWCKMRRGARRWVWLPTKHSGQSCWQKRPRAGDAPPAGLVAS
jgi:hypothetical protein